MARVIAIANQKGGVGKTTTAVNLAACLEELNHRVLAIDLDTQGNLTQHFGIPSEELKVSMAHVLMNQQHAIDDIVWKVEGLHIAPSNLVLEGVVGQLIAQGISGHTVLQERLKPIQKNYDYIVIDCPPSTGVLTANALVAASEVIVPIAIDYFSLLGIQRLLVGIDDAKKLNKKLKVGGYLLTRVDGNNKSMNERVRKRVHSEFSDKMFNTEIPKNVTLTKAPAAGKPVIYVDSNSKGATAYRNLAREVIAWAG